MQPKGPLPSNRYRRPSRPASAATSKASVTGSRAQLGGASVLDDRSENMATVKEDDSQASDMSDIRELPTKPSGSALRGFRRQSNVSRSTLHSVLSSEPGDMIRRSHTAESRTSFAPSVASHSKTHRTSRSVLSQDTDSDTRDLSALEEEVNILNTTRRTTASAKSDSKKKKVVYSTDIATTEHLREKAIQDLFQQQVNIH